MQPNEHTAPDGLACAAPRAAEQTVLSAVREGVRDVCGELVLGQALAGLQGECDAQHNTTTAAPAVQVRVAEYALLHVSRRFAR